jgi:hypothetical protein
MRKEEIWCDSCGRQIQLKNVPTGSQDFNNADKSWELWSPRDDDDAVLCSLECVVTKAQEKIAERDRVENLEQPLG